MADMGKYETMWGQTISEETIFIMFLTSNHQKTNLVFPIFFQEFFSALAVEKENKLWLVQTAFFSVMDQYINSPIPRFTNSYFFIKQFIYLLFFLHWNHQIFSKSWEGIKMHFTESWKQLYVTQIFVKKIFMDW